MYDGPDGKPFDYQFRTSNVRPFEFTDVTFASRRAQLAATMPGFDFLIDAVQGMLVGWSVATGEIWEMWTVGDTLAFARDRLDELVSMTESWGLEK
jgi:hypothetical protein